MTIRYHDENLAVPRSTASIVHQKLLSSRSQLFLPSDQQIATMQLYSRPKARRIEMWKKKNRTREKRKDAKTQRPATSNVARRRAPTHASTSSLSHRLHLHLLVHPSSSADPVLSSMLRSMCINCLYICLNMHINPPGSNLGRISFKT